VLGTQAGLLQRNVNEGYAFSADIYLERNGAPFDMHMHTPATPARSAMFPLRRRDPERAGRTMRRRARTDRDGDSGRDL